MSSLSIMNLIFIAKLDGEVGLVEKGEPRAVDGPFQPQ